MLMPSLSENYLSNIKTPLVILNMKIKPLLSNAVISKWAFVIITIYKTRCI